MRRPRGHELGEANKAADWNGEFGGVSAKGGRIHWDVAGSRRSQKEQAGGECENYAVVPLFFLNFPYLLQDLLS